MGRGRIVAVAAVLAAATQGAGAALGAQACPAAINGLGSGAVYYVSPSGSDGNSGTSPCAPWQTMSRVESFGPKPGATVAFEGGQTFSTSLSPWGGTAGTAAEPIYYTSYGDGQADLTGGIYLNSVAHLTFYGLNVTSASGPGIGTSGGGSGVTDVTVQNSTVSSTYAGGIGGYGIGLRNARDARWSISGDTIAETADSGVASLGSNVTITGNVLADNGVGRYCGTGTGQNPCHAIYAKGPAATVIGNTISSPQTSGVSLRYQGDLVQDNTISGGQKGIAFSSETTTPGTTYILGNSLSGQSDTAIQVDGGTQQLYESFVISSNTVYEPGKYGLYIVSGPDSATSQSITLADNLVEVGGAAAGYLNLAAPIGYTRATYGEHYDSFYGTGSAAPYFVNGTGRSWNTYRGWFGAGSAGQSDMTGSNPLLDPTTFAVGTGSPAIAAGTASVPGVAFQTTSCPWAPDVAPMQWRYCGAAPDIGSH
jgi:hypothetical protein